MPDIHVPVPLPMQDGQTRATLALLSLVATFADPARTNADELTARFASSTITPETVSAFLEAAAVVPLDLTSHLDLLSRGDATGLHAALQAQNQQGVLQLLAISHAHLLANEQGVTFTQSDIPCYLVRTGYSEEADYGYYLIGLPGLESTESHVTFASLVASGITHAWGISPPAPPVDMVHVGEMLHIQEQALVAASSAHATATTALTDLTSALETARTAQRAVTEALGMVGEA